jgi:hypothetical protein
MVDRAGVVHDEHMFSHSSESRKAAWHSRDPSTHGLLGALIAYVSVVSVGVAAAAAVIGVGIPVETLTATF